MTRIPRSILLGLTICLAMLSCQKELNFDDALVPGTGSAASCKSCTYQPWCHGSVYTYIDSSFGGTAAPTTATINIVSDTTIDGKVFQKFTNPGADGYYNCTNGVSTVIAYNIPSSGGTVQRVTSTLLKANEPVGATWQDVNTNGAGQSFTYNYTIISKGNSRTVLGVNFPDVIHVRYTTEITVPIFGNMVMSTTDNYFANNVGLIDSDTYDATLGISTLHRVIQSYNIP